MTLTGEQQKNIFIALSAALALLIIYRFFTAEQPKTAPLTYLQGSVASSPIRPGLATRGEGADPLKVFLQRREEKFPGVTRDIFRMENPKPKPKLAPVSVVTPTAP